MLIALLGNRDLQFKKELKEINLEKNGKYHIIKKRDSSFKSECEKILKDYDKLSKYFVLPLIEKALEISKQEEVLLITTDQKDADEKYKGNDTIIEGKIIQKYLSERYNVKTTLEVIDFNVNNFERLISFFKTIFKRYRNKELFFEISGGVPNIRNPIYLFGTLLDNVKAIYLISEDGNVFDVKNSFSELFDLLKIQDSIIKLVKNYNYSGAIDILPKSESKSIKILKDILILGIDKLNFNAKIYVNNKYLKEFVYLKDNMNYHEEYIAKIQELIDIIEIQIKQENWQNLVGIIFRLYDALGIYLFYKSLINKEIPQKKLKELLKDENFDDIIIKHVSKTETFKKAKQIYDKNLKKEKEEDYLKISVGPIFFYCFFKATNEKRYKDYLELLEFALYKKSNSKRNLRSMRNSGIYAHSFKSVTKQDIEETVGNIENFFNRLKRVSYEIIGKEQGENLFDKLNGFFEKKLNEEIINLI